MCTEKLSEASSGYVVGKYNSEADHRKIITIYGRNEIIINAETNL